MKHIDKKHAKISMSKKFPARAKVGALRLEHTAACL